MQPTVFTQALAIALAAAALPPEAVSPSRLLAGFAAVPDPRRRQGTRYPLPALLALAVTAVLANHLSVLALAEWGAMQSHELLARLGFPAGRTPHQSTFHRLFRHLDPVALAAALHQGGQPPVAPVPPPRGSRGVAVDGKAQRGRRAFETLGCPVPALTAYSHEQGMVLAQLPITATGEKAEAELTVAPALLARLDWHGAVFTGDALFCQRSLCQQVLQAGGDYLLVVKENQPTLYHDIRLLFDPPFAPLPLADRREARTVDHGHGRHHEVRQLVASTDLAGYSDWPGLAQVFRLERCWEQHGNAHGEVH
jgi:hypothetical protein